MKALERRLASHAPDLTEEEMTMALESMDMVSLSRYLILQEKRISLLNERMAEAEGMLDDIRDAVTAIHESTERLAADFSDIRELHEAQVRRVDELDRLLSVRMGRLRIPVDITGIVAALSLLVAAYLLWAQRFDVLRDPLFSLAVGGTFAGAVVVKFWLTNR